MCTDLSMALIKEKRQKERKNAELSEKRKKERNIDRKTEVDKQLQ